MKKIMLALSVIFLAAGCSSSSSVNQVSQETKSSESRWEQVFIVAGKAMSPTLADKEGVVMDRLAKTFVRDDIVVFKYPKDQSQYFIKRIIGLPGEKVEVKNARVYINSQPLDESAYLSPEVQTFGKQEVVELKENEYFVLGDNRTASSDSRVWGPLNKDLIVGKMIRKATNN